MRQYLRKVRATLGSLQINFHDGDQLKIAFYVSKDISGEANDATIEIYNLREDHRNAVGKEFEDITLEAGYESREGSNVGIIFTGQIRDVEHTRDGPDIITIVACGDGDRGLRRATTSKSFPKGTPIKEVLEQIQQDLEAQGVRRGEWQFPDGFEERTLKRPYTACGGCQREMNMLGRSFGFYWSVQNGATEVIPSDGAFDQVVLLTPDTGLIDVPTITDNGVKVSALLNPEIRPNRRVKIESQVLEMNAAEGVYRVSSATYEGDNRDGDFAVHIHGEAMNADKVDEGNP